MCASRRWWWQSRDSGPGQASLQRGRSVETPQNRLCLLTNLLVQGQCSISCLLPGMLLRVWWQRAQRCYTMWHSLQRTLLRNHQQGSTAFASRLAQPSQTRTQKRAPSTAARSRNSTLDHRGPQPSLAGHISASAYLVCCCRSQTACAAPPAAAQHQGSHQGPLVLRPEQLWKP